MVAFRRHFRKHWPAMFAAVLLAALPAVAAERHPVPSTNAGGQPTQPPALSTGRDLTITAIVTSGPNASSAFCPIITVRNSGTVPLSGTYGLRYTCNGQIIFFDAVTLTNLAPGGTVKTDTVKPVNVNFAKYGDVAEATIDYDNKLLEDNESNNTFSTTIRAPLGRLPTETLKK